MAPVALADGKLVHASDGSTFVLHAIPRFYSGEVGARLMLWRRLEATVALWASYLENETQFDADMAAFVPASPVRRLGVDLSVRARFTAWLDGDLYLSQAAATAIPSGAEIALAPRLYLTGGLTAAWHSMRGGLRVRYLGERPLFDENSPEYQYTRE